MHERSVTIGQETRVAPSLTVTIVRLAGRTTEAFCLLAPTTSHGVANAWS